MKVILKGGSKEENEKIKKFFMKEIFPILDFGIAIEPSDAVITVFEKCANGMARKYIDPTAEVIVELTEKAKNMAMDPEVDVNELKMASENFYDEALAIRKLASSSLSFSIEYYSCRYAPPSKVKKVGCEMCGSIEHMQSANGLCPGCGK